jgi:hypothetical protein
VEGTIPDIADSSHRRHTSPATAALWGHAAAHGFTEPGDPLSGNQRGGIQVAAHPQSQLWSHRSGYSKSKRVELNLAVSLEPDGRADEFRLVVPGSTSNDAKACIGAL